MGGILPTVRSGGVALYPIARHNNYSTSVAKFVNASEQRFPRTAPLADLELKYTDLQQADRDALKNFFITQKGRFDPTWSFTLSATYGNCAFLDDSFEWTEGSNPLLYSLTLRFRQTISSGAVSGSGTSIYPTLSSGVSCQRPFTQARRFRTAVNDTPSGYRYTYGFYGMGLEGFPARALMSWKLEYPALPDADCQTLEAFFAQQRGRYGLFQFTDPDDNSIFTNVRFDMDAFEYRYLYSGVSSTTISLIETN